jgi:hypothetical protein
MAWFAEIAPHLSDATLRQLTVSLNHVSRTLSSTTPAPSRDDTETTT